MTDNWNHRPAIRLKDHYSWQGVYLYFATFVTCWPSCQSSVKVFRSPFAASLWHKFGLNIKTLPQCWGHLRAKFWKPFLTKAAFPQGGTGKHCLTFLCCMRNPIDGPCIACLWSTTTRSSWSFHQNIPSLYGYWADISPLINTPLIAIAVKCYSNTKMAT